jgi:hypothetical protein
VAGSINNVRERWFSSRAIALHVAVLLFTPGCALAGWWQITRAQDGNGLSYLYSVEWPIFALLGLYFWWMLLHTDYESVGLRGMRRQAGAKPAPLSDAAPTAPALLAGAPEETDRELADYNARLATLAGQGPKTWRTPERTVVRRSRTS